MLLFCLSSCIRQYSTTTENLNVCLCVQHGNKMVNETKQTH